jgi:hypothetical protein
LATVGYVSGPETEGAALWNGSAGSAVDLNPSDLGISISTAFATTGSQQVGVGQVTGSSDDHALLWSGTAESAVDLNPTNLSGFTNSTAVATNGIQQVGSAFGDAADSQDMAIVWTGAADSAENLQPFLPADGSWTYSDAKSIDSSGNIFGVANGTYDGVTGNFVVEWSPVPEPTPLALSMFATMGLLRRRMRSYA